MSVLVRFAVIAAVLLTAAAPQAAADDQSHLDLLRESVKTLELELERSRRLIPSSIDDDERLFRQKADRLGLRELEIRRLGDEESGLPADREPLVLEVHHVELSGRESFESVKRFLSIIPIGQASRIQSVRVQAREGDTVFFTARLELPILPFASSGGSASTVEQEIDRLSAHLSRLQSAIEAIERFSSRPNPMGLLSRLEETLDGHPIALTDVTLGEESSIEGLLVGSAARSALVVGLPSAGFDAKEPVFTPQGGCQKFSIRARTNQDAWNDSSPLGRNFESGAAAFCEGLMTPGPPRSIIARGAPQDADRAVLQLRDVEFADLFFVLHDLFLWNFIVDENVNGRVSLEVYESASIDGLLEAIRSAVVISGEGSLRRVSKAGFEPGVPGSPAGGPTQPVMMTLAKANVSDVLCTIGQISERELRIPRDLKARVSFFAEEIPLDQILDGVIASAGLSPTIDGARLLLNRSGEKPEASTNLVACEERDLTRRSILDGEPARIEMLSVDDLTLVGVSTIGEDPRAWVYNPWRRLLPLETGQRLGNATVRRIGSDGVTFETDRGTKVEARLPGAPGD